MTQSDLHFNKSSLAAVRSMNWRGTRTNGEIWAGDESGLAGGEEK